MGSPRLVKTRMKKTNTMPKNKAVTRSRSFHCFPRDVFFDAGGFGTLILIAESGVSDAHFGAPGRSYGKSVRVLFGFSKLRCSSTMADFAARKRAA